MNTAMFSHFFLIIIIFGTSLLCSSILKILLTLVVSIRLCLIIPWISIMLLLIIRWIILSMRFPIMIFVSFSKIVCLWDLYISANWWNTSTYCWCITNNYNIFIFNRWFFAVLINIFGIVWFTIELTSFCCFTSKSWNIIIFITDNERKNN